MGDLTADETAEVHKMGREDINPPDRQEVVFMQNEDKEALENVFMALYDEDAEENMAFLGTPEQLKLIEKINSGELNIFDAARQNDIPRLAKILEHQPGLADQADWADCTPLQLACMLRSYEAAELLMAGGASANRRDPLGRLPLDYVRDPGEEGLHAAYSR